MTGPIGELYHVGIVVDDFDSACADYARNLGISWSPVIETSMPVWAPGQGSVVHAFKAVYSVEAPHIEIVRAIPGTIIVPQPGRPIHHLGYWTDDIVRDSARLAARGNPLVFCPMHEGAPIGMAYHQLPDGTFVELIDRAAFPDWMGFLTGIIQFESAV